MEKVAVQTIPESDIARGAYYCRAAARYETRGEYEQACNVLAPVWDGPGKRPKAFNNSGVDSEILLRAGSLTARLGNKRLAAGWQEAAKDLLTTAAEQAESAGLIEIWGEARKCLGVCYFREGAFDEARDILEDAYRRTPGARIQIQIMVDLAMLEQRAGHTQRALTLYRSIAARIENETNAVQASFHNGLKYTWEELERYDEALIAMEACCYHLELSGNERYRTGAEINFANLLVKVNRVEDAHLHLDHAEQLAKRRHDKYHLAQAKDSRADVFVVQKDYGAAERVSFEAVNILLQSDEHGLLIDCLVKRARILNQLQRRAEAITAYVQAHEIAVVQAGSERAAKVALEMLHDTAGDLCMDSHVTLREAVKEFEASFIKSALDASDQQVTAAAMRLGLSQPMLSHLLETKHVKLRQAPKGKRGIIRTAGVKSLTRSQKKTLR